MNDPLNDPDFPDRPNTADFWRLSEILLRWDGGANEEDRDPKYYFEEMGEVLLRRDGDRSKERALHGEQSH